MSLLIWKNTKKKYCDFLLEIKQIWDECEEDIGDLKEEIFFENNYLDLK